MSDQAFDLFISHRKPDKVLIKPIVNRLLDEFSIRSWLDEWDLTAGKDWETQIDDALNSCSCCAVFLGSKGWGEYHIKEARVAIDKSNKNQNFLAIPVLLPGASETDMKLLGDFFYKRHRVDFSNGLTDDTAFLNLKSAIKGEAQGPPNMTAFTIRRDAQRWNNSPGKDKSLLYRGYELREGQKVAAQFTGSLNELTVKFLTASAEDEQRVIRQERKRNYIIMVVLAILILGLTGATVYAFSQRNEADRQTENSKSQAIKAQLERDRATGERRRADSQAQIAKDERDLANQQRKLADLRKVEAENQRNLAILAQNEAERQKEIVQNQLARTLWNNSQTAIGTKDFLGALHFATEAANTSKNRTLTSNILADFGSYVPKTMLKEILSHNSDVNSAVFSPDGTRILTVSNDKAANQYMPISNVRLWNVMTGKQIGRSMLKNNFKAMNVAFSSDGKRILITGISYDRSLRQLSNDSPVDSPIMHEYFNAANAAFSPDDGGKRVLVAGSDKRLHVLEFGSGKELLLSIALPASSKQVIFSPDGKQFISIAGDSTLHRWDATSGKEIKPSIRQNAEITSIGFSHDGESIVTACRDSTARTWSLRTGEQTGKTMKHGAYIYSAVFRPNTMEVLTASYDNTARLWNSFTGKQIGPPMIHKGPVYIAVFNSIGDKILTVSNKDATIWEAGTGTQISTSMRHDAFIRTADFSPNGKFVLTTSYDKTARLWEVHTEQHLVSPIFNHIALDLQPVKSESNNPLKQVDTKVKWELKSPSQKYLATVGFDNIVRIWSISSRKIIDSIKHQELVKSVVFSADERYVLTAGSDSIARLYDIRKRKQIGSLVHEGGINTAIFSPHGEYLLTGSEDKSSRLWSSHTLKQIGPSMRHDDSTGFLSPVTGVTIAIFSRDGKRILTTSNDKKVRIWETGTGRQIGPPMQHNDFVTKAVFSSDGNYVLTHCNDGSTHRMKIETDFDIPLDLLKLQAAVISGMAFNPQTSENFYIPADEWYMMKKTYSQRASEHFRKCKYPGENLWGQFNKNEAKLIRPEFSYR